MTPPDVSAVVVTHGNASDALACVASLRRAFEEEKISGEIVLVDCGSGAQETRRLESAGADVFLPLAENRGYSGGVNAGLSRARSFRLVLSNADVEFRSGALHPLLEAIEDPGVGAAAPLAFWDSQDRLRLPSGWAPGFRSDLAQLSAGRSASRDDARFASYAREAVRLWQRGGETRQLSGAVLAARRDTFDRVGRFDERFPFEYEETEWEDRVRARGLALRFVPAARVHHGWGATAADAGETAARRAVSRRLYWRERYGAIRCAVLERAARRRTEVPYPRITEPVLAARDGAWAAISTNPSLLPFAGTPLEADFRLPREVEARLSGATLYLRSFRESDGRPLETFVWEGAGE
ncbi:MAG TPA: glycosyltransferase [Thermoanaerobaculia bacterium]|nr:glycosyltransferase [Thermoanaerobaculia bacterium]